jgi:hypothetical protein
MIAEEYRWTLAEARAARREAPLRWTRAARLADPHPWLEPADGLEQRHRRLAPRPSALQSAWFGIRRPAPDPLGWGGSLAPCSASRSPTSAA